MDNVTDINKYRKDRSLEGSFTCSEDDTASTRYDFVLTEEGVSVIQTVISKHKKYLNTPDEINSMFIAEEELVDIILSLVYSHQEITEATEN